MPMAYAKISVTEQLLSSGLADDEAWLAQVLRDCLPQRLVERFTAVMNEHPLGTRSSRIDRQVRDRQPWTGSAFRVQEETVSAVIVLTGLGLDASPR